VRTYEIKLQLNNAAGGRLYFIRYDTIEEINVDSKAEYTA